MLALMLAFRLMLALPPPLLPAHHHRLPQVAREHGCRAGRWRIWRASADSPREKVLLP